MSSQSFGLFLQHGFEQRMRHTRFLWTRWILCFPLHGLGFCFRIILETPYFPTSNNPIKTPLHSSKTIWNLKTMFFLIFCQYSRCHLCGNLSHTQILFKSSTVFLFNSLAIIRSLNFDLSVQGFVLCLPHLHESFSFLVAHFLRHHVKVA